MATTVSPPKQAPQHGAHWKHFRWYICGLLFFATTINYIDRQVLGLLKPVLEKELGWSETDYGWIVFAFQLAYALMMPVAGRLIDWLGTRLGYALAVILWSIAAILHAPARNAFEFQIARFALGLGESANFPAAIKTVADWFPQRERALATGIFNSGANIGAVFAPIVVPFLAVTVGWRAAFVVTGAIGFLWVVLWWWLFREPEEHPRVSREELQLIRGDSDSGAKAVNVSYVALLGNRAAWAFMLGKFLTDPVWWFYLFWLPGFLNRTYGVDLVHLGLPLVVVYTATSVGSIGGGWISSALLNIGWSTNKARKTAMLICAVATTAGAFVAVAGGNLWLAVGLVSVAAAAHQGWSANLYTLVSDTFPRSMVGSVIGFGGMGGAVGGLLVAPAVGKWLDLSNGAYGPLFAVAGGMYLVALVVIHLLVPRIQQNSGTV
ncbi:MAG: MFS transporter [Acidobacteria bacterium]|nr:MFS transporter [Acidobacteriota bacterium]